MTIDPGDGPSGGEGGQHGGDAAPHPTGSMRFQDGSTTPREPSVGEVRARRHAQRQHAEQQVAQAQAAEAKRKRKRLLIGGATAVGVAGVVAALYAVNNSGGAVSARCVDSSGTVVSDTYCGGSSHYGSHGIYVFGGGSYRYNYGGSGTVGEKASGGSSVAPKGSSVTGSSGTSTSSVSRGGFGGGTSSASGSGRGGSSSGG